MCGVKVRARTAQKVVSSHLSDCWVTERGKMRRGQLVEITVFQVTTGIPNCLSDIMKR